MLHATKPEKEKDPVERHDRRGPQDQPKKR